MSKKIIGFTVIVLGFILAGGLVYLLFFSDKDIMGLLRKEKGGGSALEATTTTPESPNVKTISLGQGTKISPSPAGSGGQSGAKPGPYYGQEVTKEDLMRLAASFSERYGTYSNQSNFSNIVDLKIFMSRRMKQWTDEYVLAQKQKASTDRNIYYGITTKAIAEEIKEYDDHIGKVEILVNTRRREATSTITNTSSIFNQQIIIHLVKEENAWKVDQAVWSEKNGAN